HPAIAVCLAGAAIIQLFDVQPLREQIIASITDGAGAAELHPGEGGRLFAGARPIQVRPSLPCSDWRTGLTRGKAELMLAAARKNVPINTVYLARYTYGVTLRDVLREPSRTEEKLAAQRDVYCKQEIERARSGGRRGYIFVLLSDQPRPEE